MKELPTGTVTFLFTDIEGSTRLLLRLGDDYPGVLEAHARVLRNAISGSGGLEVSTEGDSFFAVFESAPSALVAAIEAQRGLVAEQWPTGTSVRVRMGLHTGEGVLGGDNYVGLDVNRGARISAAGHGGQVLVSDSVRQNLDQLPPQITLRDLGQHRLKDLPEAEHLFQAQASDLPGDFPPPRSLEARPHNLPSELSEFVGRAEEADAIEQLLTDARLVTLIGPGGSGKTRLALKVASRVLPRFGDGVFFVPLWSIGDPDLVIPAIAAQLGVPESADRSLVDATGGHLADKHLLLVIDNFEQVLPAASELSRLLTSAPEVRILVTSRSVLRVGGEQTFEVPPMALPDPSGMDPEGLLRTDAVNLFVQRARSADPTFAPTGENIRAIGEIAAQVDGLPLAIELAAARVRLFTPVQLAERLKGRPDLLRGDAVDAPERHQTLMDSIAWSYELLTESDRAALRRLSVFAGGFTLDAAEEVASGDPVQDVIERVASLLDNSLLRHLVIAGERRFTILNTIREFATEQLRDQGEFEELSRRHAEFFLGLAEEAEPHLTGDNQVAWFDRLSAEMENLRATFAYSLDHDDPDLGLRMGGAIWRLWHARGQPAEGREWLQELLGRPGSAPEHRAKGLSGLAGLAYWQAGYEEAWSHYQEALAIYRDLDDDFHVADTLFALSTTSTWMGEEERGADLADQALGMFRELGAEDRVGMVLMAQGFARWMKGDLDGARPLWEQSLEIAEDLGDHAEAATKALALASLSYQKGQHQAALDESLAALRRLSDLRNVSGMVMALDWVAALTAVSEPRRAVKLAGAADALRGTLGGGMQPEGVGLEGARKVAARSLTPDDIEEAWEEGRQLSLEQAVSEALEAPYSLAAADRE